MNVPLKEYEGRVIGVVCRKNDCEDKLLVAPMDMKIAKEEAKRSVSFQEKYFDSEIVLIE